MSQAREGSGSLLRLMKVTPEGCCCRSNARILIVHASNVEERNANRGG
jgi:hypothetical protein